MSKERTVEDFFNNEYLSYARYVVENRAIPSAIDGFKPTQRKIAYAANKHWKTGNEKPLKVFQLAGTVAATTFYHHGNASLESAIIGMAQDFKNSMPIFQGIGQFGSLRSPEAGAPRYVGVKFNDNFRLLYKDFDLLASQYEEGEEIEPRHFLPIIPTVLLNGGSGIAVGFATNILNRNPVDIIDACLDALNGKKIRSLPPWIKGFDGLFEQSEDNPKSWDIYGAYEVKNTTTVEILEVPPSFTYEKYEQLLNSLIEKDIITSYDDASSKNVSYTLKFTRQKLADLIAKDKLMSLLRLHERDTENLTTLDPEGKLKIFDSVQDIVIYFVDFRLGFYQKRKDKLIQNLTHELNVLENRSRFIKMIVDQELIVNMRTKQEIEKDLLANQFLKVNDSWSYLTSMPIHSLTKEKLEELFEQLQKTKNELSDIQSKDPKEMYILDLKELKKKLTKETKRS